MTEGEVDAPELALAGKPVAIENCALTGLLNQSPSIRNTNADQRDFKGHTNDLTGKIIFMLRFFEKDPLVVDRVVAKIMNLCLS